MKTLASIIIITLALASGTGCAQLAAFDRALAGNGNGWNQQVGLELMRHGNQMQRDALNNSNNSSFQQYNSQRYRTTCTEVYGGGFECTTRRGLIKWGVLPLLVTSVC